MRALAHAFVLGTLALFASACSNLPSCPSSVPADGTSCSHRAFVCEFNGGDHERCSTISTCSNTESSTWSNSSDAMCTMTNDASCGSTFLSNSVGDTCPTSGVSCDYPDGRCSCVPCAGGSSSGNVGLAWQCRSWDEGIDSQCDTDRPALGSSCKKDGLVCHYDNTCTVSFGPDIQCLNGRWQPLNAAPQVCATPTCGINN